MVDSFASSSRVRLAGPSSALENPLYATQVAVSTRGVEEDPKSLLAFGSVLECCCLQAGRHPNRHWGYKAADKSFPLRKHQTILRTLLQRSTFLTSGTSLFACNVCGPSCGWAAGQSSFAPHATLCTSLSRMILTRGAGKNEFVVPRMSFLVDLHLAIQWSHVNALPDIEVDFGVAKQWRSEST